MPNKLRIVIFDLETSPVEYLKFQKDRNPFFSSEGIINDSYMISAAWKVKGEAKVHSVQSNTPWDDYKAVKKLRDELSKADVLVGHNIDKFDIKFLNSRIMYHGLPPLPLIPTVDTIKEVKRVASFTSHKLDYLTYLFGIGQKVHVSFSLWKDVVRGSRTALKEMVAYNKQDVVVTENLYNYLLPYMKTHPHSGVLIGKSRFHSCPNCGSSNLKKNGIRPTRAGILKQEVQCKNCYSYHRIPLEKL